MSSIRIIDVHATFYEVGWLIGVAMMVMLVAMFIININLLASIYLFFLHQLMTHPFRSDSQRLDPITTRSVQTETSSLHDRSRDS